MADGDVVIDSEHSFPDGSRVRIFAVESSTYPGGVNYRFQYYDPTTGNEFLRYDNSQVETHGAGHHHRHEWTGDGEQVSGLEFTDLETHIAQFRTELTELR
jgi:hypothetical protein